MIVAHRLVVLLGVVMAVVVGGISRWCALHWRMRLSKQVRFLDAK